MAQPDAIKSEIIAENDYICKNNYRVLWQQNEISDTVRVTANSKTA